MTLWQKLSDLTGAVSDGGRGLMSIFGGDASAPATSDLRKAGTSVTFTIAVVALSAKMAKADGVVLGVEKDAFHRCFRIDPAQAGNVERVFTLAQQDTAGFETYAEQIASSLDHDPIVLGDVIDGLLHIATADRAMHPGEDRFLAEVARRFGLADAVYRHHRARFVMDDASPYDVLGLTPAAGDDEIKARHRKLVRENHPDLLTGRGLPPETIALATRRLVAINDAWRAVARERGM